MGQIGRKLWKGFFNDFLYKGLSNLHIWNDMNEPSVFSGPETTAPKDVIHAGGFEERSIHNVYGLTVHETTFNATREFYSDSETRPFVLTRSFCRFPKDCSYVDRGQCSQLGLLENFHPYVSL